MKLLSPPLFIIHFTKFNQHCRFEFQNLLASQFFSSVNLIENSLDFCISIVFSIKFFYTMIRKFTTLFRKKVMALTQCGNHIVKSRNCNTAYFRQFLYISTKICRNLYRHGFIRTPSRKHFNLKATFTSFNMIFK